MLGQTLEDVQRLVRSLGYRLLDIDGRPARSLRLDEYLMVRDEAAAAPPWDISSPSSRIC